MSKRSARLIKGIILDNNQREERTRLLQAKMADGLVVKYVSCEDCGSAIKIQMSFINYIMALSDKSFNSLVCDKCFSRLFSHDVEEYLTSILGENYECEPK